MKSLSPATDRSQPPVSDPVLPDIDAMVQRSAAKLADDLQALRQEWSDLYTADERDVIDPTPAAAVLIPPDLPVVSDHAAASELSAAPTAVPAAEQAPTLDQITPPAADLSDPPSDPADVLDARAAAVETPAHAPEPVLERAVGQDHLPVAEQTVRPALARTVDQFVAPAPLLPASNSTPLVSRSDDQAVPRHTAPLLPRPANGAAREATVRPAQSITQPVWAAHASQPPLPRAVPPPPQVETHDRRWLLVVLTVVIVLTLVVPPLLLWGGSPASVQPAPLPNAPAEQDAHPALLPNAATATPAAVRAVAAATPTSALATPTPAPPTSMINANVAASTLPRPEPNVRQQLDQALAQLHSGAFRITLQSDPATQSSALMRFTMPADNEPQMAITTMYTSTSGVYSTERVVVGEQVWDRQGDEAWAAGSAQVSVTEQVQTYLPRVPAAVMPEVTRDATTITLRWYDAHLNADVLLTLDVASGAPRLFRQAKRATGSMITITYDGWNQPVEIARPRS